MESKTLIPLNVVKDRVQMSELIKAAGYEFENGRAYYEFVREEEDIFDDTDIVLMKRVIITINLSHVLLVDAYQFCLLSYPSRGLMIIIVQLLHS